MTISVFDLFSIGIGPSSSHTVGPMRIAKDFLDKAKRKGVLSSVEGIRIELFGSLAFTGVGHGTDKAIILGLLGYLPESVDPDDVPTILHTLEREQRLNLLGEKTIPFSVKDNFIYNYKQRQEYHSNAMRMDVLGLNGDCLFSDIYYSLGGGFFIDHASTLDIEEKKEETTNFPYSFESGNELLAICKREQLTVSQIVMENEKTLRSEEEVKTELLSIWSVMKASIERGCREEGILPGGLGVQRRAAKLYKKLLQNKEDVSCVAIQDPSEIFDWVSLFALAVNEENAAGGRVVTAPTNGAAGVLPAVLRYYELFTQSPNEQGIIDFLLVAGAIGILYKKGASLSAAEMGCQGEVGVACSMAAGGLVAALGGDALKIENAAEIGMEHNLGLTCDPVGGLVQIPCIERNTMGAIKAIGAARLALRGEGTQKVSLDKVIKTMKQTGKDMNSIYKETSQGGLAVNVPEC